MPRAKFTAANITSSKPLPLTSLYQNDVMQALKSLNGFFSDPNTVHTLFPEHSEVKTLLPTKQHEKLYQEMHNEHIVHLDSSPDTCSSQAQNDPATVDQRKNVTILEVSFPCVTFPGCQVFTKDTLWVEHRITNNLDENDAFLQLPEMHVTLLNSKKTAKGSRFVVWLFDKIVGNKTDTKEEEEAMESDVIKHIDEQDDEESDEDNVGEKKEGPTTVTHQRISVKASAVGEVQLISEVIAEIRLKIPKTLMKLLPMSLEKFEYDGSKKVQRAIDREMSSMMERLCEHYLKQMSPGGVQMLLQ